MGWSQSVVEKLNSEQRSDAELFTNTITLPPLISSLKQQRLAIFHSLFFYCCSKAGTVEGRDIHFVSNESYQDSRPYA